jgi:hypothetical protein
MKLTLLDMVQDIANDLETDEINSINDTVESQQIAQIIKTSFFEMIGNRNWAHLKRTFQFENASDVTKPTHIKTPVLLKELVLFNYNKRKPTDTKDKYGSIKWYEPEEFLLNTNGRDSSQDNVETVTDFGGVSLYIRNDKTPEFCTSFDDEYLVLDSWDSISETTIEGSRTQAVGYIEPTWEQIDGFIPDLPSESFPALLAEAKSTAFVVLKQQTNEKAEQKAQRQQRWLSRKDWTIKGGVRYPNYGRRKNMQSTNSNPLFSKDQ